MVEGLLSDSFVSIRLLNPDDNRLWYVASGGLPSSYVEAFDGVTVGPTEGSCGTAAHRNEPVIVSGIDEDPAWEPRRALASTLGIRASWSTPIRASDGHVLGTLAIVSPHPGLPTAFHQTVITEVTRVASLAITHTRQQAELRQREKQYRQIIDAIPHLIGALSPEGRLLYANRTLLEYSGLNEHDL